MAYISDKPRKPPKTTKRRTFGLKIFYEPNPASSAVADVVFIHGLTGAWDTTWTDENSTGPWPKNFLSQDITDIRILSWGYDADIVNLWNPISNNRVANHAQNLIGDLTRKRVDWENRKIIFVVHNLGGLVLEEALYLSWNNPDEHLRPVARSTVAIAFLGTPHHGSDKAAWRQSGLLLARLEGSHQVNDAVMNLLDPGSEMLASIQARFHGNLRVRTEQNYPIAITCFYEEYGHPEIGEIVPQHSAILPGYNSYGLNANHEEMTKFTGSDDNNYERVLGEIDRWVKAQRALPNVHSQNPLPLRGTTYTPGVFTASSQYPSPPPLPPQSNKVYPYQQISGPSASDSPYQSLYPESYYSRTQQHPPDNYQQPGYNPPLIPGSTPQSAYHAQSLASPYSGFSSQQDYNSVLAAITHRGDPSSYEAMLKAFEQSKEQAQRDIIMRIAADTATRSGRTQPDPKQLFEKSPSDAMAMVLKDSQAQYQREFAEEVARRTKEIERDSPFQALYTQSLGSYGIPEPARMPGWSVYNRAAEQRACPSQNGPPQPHNRPRDDMVYHETDTSTRTSDLPSRIQNEDHVFLVRRKDK